MFSISCHSELYALIISVSGPGSMNSKTLAFSQRHHSLKAVIYTIGSSTRRFFSDTAVSLGNTSLGSIVLLPRVNSVSCGHYPVPEAISHILTPPSPRPPGMATSGFHILIVQLKWRLTRHRTTRGLNSRQHVCLVLRVSGSSLNIYARCEIRWSALRRSQARLTCASSPTGYLFLQALQPVLADRTSGCVLEGGMACDSVFALLVLPRWSRPPRPLRNLRRLPRCGSSARSSLRGTYWGRRQLTFQCISGPPCIGHV
ncbi:hypothetical protein BV22DRAFT_122395 [Leucogyrophana mollusca]|uniref:Uncharacterized protein n=1 Tax=Leucogyrophana mollusca TaxID=85980 RepID=A0ACB8BVZ9_9AGAM|nr:hypothetical protein BV22DRAFT_122395 [Leucogyrophana mollusca]